MRGVFVLLVMGLAALSVTAAEPVAPTKEKPRLQPGELDRPLKRLPFSRTPEEETQSGESSEAQPTEPTEEAEPAVPPPVTITAVDMTIDNCWYRWHISLRNDSDIPLSNLIVGGKQKAPHYNTFHGAGAVRVGSLAPGQELTKTVGWTRDIRATEFYVFVAQSESNELATQSYAIPALSAVIGQIGFTRESGNTYRWSAEINNTSTIPICGGITIVRKRLADDSMAMGALTKDLTLPPGTSSVSGIWDTSNATGFNLRLSADSGAARGGIWMLDEKEVAFTP